MKNIKATMRACAHTHMEPPQCIRAHTFTHARARAHTHTHEERVHVHAAVLLKPLSMLLTASIAMDTAATTALKVLAVNAYGMLHACV